ncbi:hypothetical protein DU500_06125 [Haloplanus rubicundus]|uniref:Uncharacterized protein n=1 Tax=Haloplanus rubicundus TaxID=1547898 RepID=A0A345E1I2_9EURY|nr:hypothetical protein [Haloplanus rubicundus]AXG06054.1 hypothetical protein DU500_06125 [Haloplanus rubicundus]AXG09398.1 hypothetical protein DU484_05650 [Haloplanus rubicundus]
MPKQIVLLAAGVEPGTFDEVARWPKQWFPDGDYTVDAEAVGGDRHRITVTPTVPLPVPDAEVYDEVEVGVDFYDGGSLAASLCDTVRPPGPPVDDEEACDPVCVE